MLLLFFGCLACGAATMALALRSARISLDGWLRQWLQFIAGWLVIASGLAGWGLGNAAFSAVDGGIGGIICYIVLALVINAALSVTLLSVLLRQHSGVEAARCWRAGLLNAVFLIPALFVLLVIGVLSVYHAWWAKVVPIVIVVTAFLLLLGPPRPRTERPQREAPDSAG